MLQRNTPPLSMTRAARESQGVSMALNCSEMLRSNRLLQQLASALNRHVQQATPVNLTLHNPGEAEAATQALEMFCRRLHGAGAPASPFIGLCLGSPATPLRAYSMITRCWLGNGPRYVIPAIGPRQASPDDPAETGFWKYLWRHHGTRWAVLPAYGDTVSTPCPLLADEKANAVLPRNGILAPAGSAWVTRRLHFPRVADSDGVVDLPALTKAAIACVDSAERLIDQQAWPTSSMQYDARTNRRVAIQLTGIGDLVRMQQVSPSDLKILRSLSQLIKHVRTTVWQRSAELARDTDLLPAIARHAPPQAVSGDQHPVHWEARWHEAVERTAVRHRNLLVMSPYAVLPGNGVDCAAFTDLLPLIDCADAHSFAAPAPLQSWNFKDFYRFHRRARAVLEQRNGPSLVATRA